jgi:hypothetical protein
MSIATRHVVSGSVALAAIGLLAACGGSDNSTSGPTPSPGTTAHAGTTAAPGTTQVVGTTEAPTTSDSSTTSESSTSSSSTSSSSTTSSTSSSSTSTTSAAGIAIQFSITPTNITCTADGKGTAVMSWTVTPTNVAIAFQVDGAGSGTAQAGFTATMNNQPLPVNFVCDGNPHRVTLIASNSAGSAQKDVLVTTTKSSSGGGGGVS